MINIIKKQNFDLNLIYYFNYEKGKVLNTLFNAEILIKSERI